MSQPTWAQIAAGIQGAIATASNLAAIWRHQSVGQPAVDYVGLSLGAAITEGADYTQERYDAARPAHSQITITTAGVREVALQLEVWSASVVESGAAASALSILDGIVTRLRLPTARSALAAVAVVPFDPGPTNWLPSIVSAGFRGRATCDVRCRMPARAIVEYADWIGSVAVVATIDGGGSAITPTITATP